MVVLVHELIASLVGIDADERLPDVAAGGDLGGDPLELVQGEKTLVRKQVAQRRERWDDERRTHSRDDCILKYLGR
jgi:hypothetical protein